MLGESIHTDTNAIIVFLFLYRSDIYRGIFDDTDTDSKIPFEFDNFLYIQTNIHITNDIIYFYIITQKKKTCKSFNKLVSPNK